MSKVIYFTNAVSQTSFTDYLKRWKVSPNLSNQNFHNKVIKAISKFDKVEVISIRPINKNFDVSSLPRLVEDEYNITWRYPKVSTSKVGKVLFLNKRIKQVSPLTNKDDVVLVDTLNLSLLKSAIKFAKKHSLKVYGVCTDNPNNISFIADSYKNKLMKLGQSLDGYISLTKAITELYNVHNKPFIQIDGVSEDIEEIGKPLINDKYIYFGGSLMEEYGVYSLIDAFLRLKLKDTKLVICGHHLQKEKLFEKIKNNDSIVYLGPVSYFDNLTLEKNALLSVNPRPINQKIDDYSIPSKTLECLSIKCLNVTVDNALLKERYGDVIIWSKSSSSEDLAEAINKALSLSKEEKDQIVENGYKKVMQRTSLKVIGEKIKSFLSKLLLD